MVATCDNEMKVYFDGLLQAASSSELQNWRQSSTFMVPPRTRVIGIECLDLGDVGGTLASFSDGMVTDARWQCSSQASSNWASSKFTDTWPDAYEIGPNFAREQWGTIHGINISAQWIWTHGWQGENTKVYCRSVISPGEPT